MFIAGHGWDTEPWPGEQNRLYLSRPGGGWRDATDGLPRLTDFSHSAAIGDLRGLGIPDIIVGNIGDDDLILPYALLNAGNETFTLDSTVLPVGPGETMNYLDGQAVTATVLADLDGDGLPDLVAAAEGSRDRPGSAILWNRTGAFSEQHKTILPTPAPFAHGHIDLDAAALDAGRRGDPDESLLRRLLRPTADEPGATARSPTRLRSGCGPLAYPAPGRPILPASVPPRPTARQPERHTPARGGRYSPTSVRGPVERCEPLARPARRSLRPLRTPALLVGLLARFTLPLTIGRPRRC